MIKLGCDSSLPKGWQWVDANSVMDVRDGTHDSPKSVDAGIPLVTSKNLIGGKIDFSTCNLISEADHLAISKRSAVDDGDILYAMIGTIGNPVIVEKQIDFSIKNVALFKFSKSSKVFNRFIYHFLNSDLAIRQFESNSRGGTQKFVSLGNIRSLQIPLPPLAEQKRIAEILDKADAIRRKRQQASQLADDFLRAVFLEMFGDPVTNPKGWEVKPLGELVVENDRINYGIVQPGDHVDGGVPIVRVGDFKNGLVDKSYLKCVSADIDEKHKKSRLKGDEILITCVGATIGKVALADPSLEGFNTVRAVTRVRLNKNINRHYVFRYLQSPFVQQYFSAELRTVGQPTLNGAQIAKTPVLIPDDFHQKKYLDIATQVESWLKNSNCHGENASEFFASLSQKAFSGQL